MRRYVSRRALVMTSPITRLAYSSTRENAWPWGGQLGGRPLRGAASSRGAPLQEVSDPQQVIGQHRRADKHLESVASLERAAPEAAAAHEHRNAPLDARAKALPPLEGPTVLVRRALRGFVSAPLGHALGPHAGGRQRLHRGGRGEPAVGRVEGGGAAEGGLVLRQRGSDLVRIEGIAIEH